MNTHDALRIKVAELTGLKDVQGRHAWYGYDSSGNAISIPDYPNDLNAICRAVDHRISNQTHALYREHLRLITSREAQGHGNDPERAYIEATAEQRCRAFALTLSSEL